MNSIFLSLSIFPIFYHCLLSFLICNFLKFSLNYFAWTICEDTILLFRFFFLMQWILNKLKIQQLFWLILRKLVWIPRGRLKYAVTRSGKTMWRYIFIFLNLNCMFPWHILLLFYHQWLLISFPFFFRMLQPVIRVLLLV